MPEYREYRALKSAVNGAYPDGLKAVLPTTNFCHDV